MSAHYAVAALPTNGVEYGINFYSIFRGRKLEICQEKFAPIPPPPSPISPPSAPIPPPPAPIPPRLSPIPPRTAPILRFHLHHPRFHFHQLQSFDSTSTSP
ncbi:Protein CBG12268 [Caenorhabditis briggsae]|uniref:Protein CBG12268 n=1 Tax=Caenorhabditis briggsae TaxID=6238 RepID=A8XF49_CAEBR|nr:Protein CBG12268 [Caenorhabditis briggsae]CAP31271.1 Protein CBG12268 [Caenorhabditis briggsae]